MKYSKIEKLFLIARPVNRHHCELISNIFAKYVSRDNLFDCSIEIESGVGSSKGGMIR